VFLPPFIGCIDSLPISIAISVPNLRNGYGMRRIECSRKAWEGDEDNGRRQKKMRTRMIPKFEKKGICYREVSIMKHSVSLLRFWNIGRFKSETHI
jgi:hypothetical protein